MTSGYKTVTINYANARRVSKETFLYFSFTMNMFYFYKQRGRVLKQSFKAKSDIKWDGHTGHTYNYKADTWPVSFGQRPYAWPIRCWAHLESALFLDCQLNSMLTSSCLQGLLHCGLRESTLPLDGIQLRWHKIIFPLWALTHFLPLIGEDRSQFPQL